MKNQNWIEAEKEHTLDSEGNVSNEKIKLINKEFNKSKIDYFDLIIKFSGIIAIFVPLLLIYLQKKHEISWDKRKALTELFVQIEGDITLLENTQIDDSAYFSTIDRLRNNYPARLLVYSNDSLFTKLLVLTQLKSFLANIKFTLRQIVSIQEAEKNIIQHLKTVAPGGLLSQSEWIKDTSTINKLFPNRIGILNYLNVFYSRIVSDSANLSTYSEHRDIRLDSIINKSLYLIKNASGLINIKEVIDITLSFSGNDLDKKYNTQSSIIDELRDKDVQYILSMYNLQRVRFKKYFLDLLKEL